MLYDVTRLSRVYIAQSSIILYRMNVTSRQTRERRYCYSLRFVTSGTIEITFCHFPPLRLSYSTRLFFCQNCDHSYRRVKGNGICSINRRDTYRSLTRDGESR